MKVTPLDIHQQEFSSAWKGYKKHEVDNFLELVADQLEALITLNDELRTNLAQAENQLASYQRQEQNLKDAVMMAQEASKDMQNTAQEKADLAIQQAQINAEKITRQAHRKAQEMEGMISDLQRQRDRFEVDLRAMLQHHNKLLDQHPRFAHAMLSDADDTKKSAKIVEMHDSTK